MPSDKIKPPDQFPLKFARPLSLGLGKWELHYSEVGPKPCFAVARKYRAFLKSIAFYPLHPFNAPLKEWDFRTSVTGDAESGWTLCIIVKKRIDFAAAMGGIKRE